MLKKICSIITLFRMDVRIESSWKEELRYIFNKDYFERLAKRIRGEYKRYIVYPSGDVIFKAFDLCSFDKVSVVLLGQDPYHNPGQANGLAFSVNKGVKLPPSLRNIYLEVENDIGCDKSFNDGDLSSWAKQGVLLLNAILTVRAHQPCSHHGLGWEQFTDDVIRHINATKVHVVYILWGSYAKTKVQLIDNSNNLVLVSVHPSPLSATKGFFGNHHFSKTNEYLVQYNKVPILW